MKTSLRTLVTISALIVALAAGAPALAQGRQRGGDPQQRVERQLDMLTDELSLTEEQRRRAEPVLLDAAEKIQAAFAAGGDRDAMRDTMRKVGKATEKRLAEFLDESQMKRYREIIEQRRRSKAKRQRGGPPQ